MEYQKIIILLDNTPNQPSKFKRKNWIKINYKSRGMHNEDNQLRFKNSMLSSSLRIFSDAYILAEGTITAAKEKATAPKNSNEKLFTSFISRINNTQVDDVQYIDAVMPIYNVIEYSDNYSKRSRISWNIVEMNQL